MRSNKTYLSNTTIKSMFVFMLICIITFFTPTALNVYAETSILGTLEDITTTFSNNTDLLTNFTIKNENEFYYVDSSNNKIVIWNNEQLDEFGESGYTAGTFTNPSMVAVLPNESIYVYDSLKRIQEFDTNYNYVNSYNIVSTNTYIPMGYLSSLTNDFANNLYLLDYENNLIIKKASGSNELIEYVSGVTLGLTFNSNTQINITANGETMFISNVNSSTNLYSLNTSSLALTEINVSTYAITNINQIATDCANNLFILDKNITNSKLHKLTRNTYAHESAINITGNVLQNIESFQINIENGKVLLNNSNSNTLQLLTLVNYTGTFTENISSFINPVEYTSTTPLTEASLIATVSENTCPLLATPYNITPILELIENEKIIILSETVSNNPDYYYILYVNNENLINFDGYVLKDNINILVSPTTPIDYDDVKALNNATKVYKYPSTLNSNLSTPVCVDILNKNEIIAVIGNASELTDANSNSFYEIQLTENTIGYVNTSDVLRTSITITEPTLQTNAEISITDNSTNVSVYSDITENITSLLAQTLLDEKRIFVGSFDNTQEWTYITFTTDNNEEISGYIKTKYITVYGEYNNLLQACILCLICFVLIIVFLIFKTSKQKERN